MWHIGNYKVNRTAKKVESDSIFLDSSKTKQVKTVLIVVDRGNEIQPQVTENLNRLNHSSRGSNTDNFKFILIFPFATDMIIQQALCMFVCSYITYAT